MKFAYKGMRFTHHSQACVFIGLSIVPFVRRAHIYYICLYTDPIKWSPIGCHVMKARTKNVFFFGVQFTKLYSLTRMKWALKVNQGEELSWLYECWMFFLFSLSFSVRIHFTSANANASIVGIAQLSDYGYFHYRFAITLMKRYSHVYFVLWAVSFDCFARWYIRTYVRWSSCRECLLID